MLNEFRQNLVSGEWVLFSTGRTHSVRKFESAYQSKEDCPFENFEKSDNEVIWYHPEKNWEVAVIKNKYPAVRSGICTPTHHSDYFLVHEAIGEHDIFVFKDHDTQMADMNPEQIVQIVQSYKKRYQEIAKLGECSKYIMLFHNFGKEAGASVYHPHSQIMSTPMLPPDVYRSFYGARKYFQEHGQRVYDDLLTWEVKEQKRIIYENDKFIAFCPFVSKFPYEVRIFPKQSHAHFDLMPAEDEKDFARALSISLKKIKLALNNPPFSFFIHTAPLGESSENTHDYYSWHLEILPKIKITAGFEMGTGVEINVIDPDEAAKLLRETTI